MVGIAGRRKSTAIPEAVIVSSICLRNKLLLCLTMGTCMMMTFHLTEQPVEFPIIDSDLLVRRTENRNNNAIDDDKDTECRFFLAESAIPGGGLGVFTARDIPKGEEAQPMADVCIYISDSPDEEALNTHTWRSTFLGKFEGQDMRAVCEGVSTLYNNVPSRLSTSEVVPLKMHHNAGLYRTRNPGAGAITHYYGITSKASRNVPAGAELTIDYGDSEEVQHVPQQAPQRSVDWLRKHGMCMDNIDIRPATDPEMGRGAFARRFLKAGSLVGPAPLMIFPDREVFASREPEALLVNYCIQPPGIDILLFPYGQGINLINHASRNKTNVGLRWSTSRLHHGDWLDLSMAELLDLARPGSLILEIFALRDISQGEELFLDYGPKWEAAWEQHLNDWHPVSDAEHYVYPADMDRTQPFRTIKELKENPYPKNLLTACFGNKDKVRRGKVNIWTAPTFWPKGLTYCNILKREKDGKTGSYLYDVSLSFGNSQKIDKKYIVKKVPHYAIMFIDKPYHSDMHLRNAFRHPIGLPEELTPKHWLIQPVINSQVA